MPENWCEKHISEDVFDGCPGCIQENLRTDLRDAVELLQVGALPNSWAVQDFLNRPSIKALIKEKP